MSEEQTISNENPQDSQTQKPDMVSGPVNQVDMKPQPVSSEAQVGLTPPSDTNSKNLFVALIIIFAFAALAGFGIWAYRNYVSKGDSMAPPPPNPDVQPNVPRVPESTESTSPVTDLEDDLNAIESDLEALEEDLDLELDMDIVVPSI